MKFTQISTLALAAMMAFSSCSKEEVTTPGEADLQPGEARIVFDLGRKGATTYSTIANEIAIKNADARLYKAVVDGGTRIPATFKLEGNKLTLTIAAGDANAKNVTFFAHANFINYDDGNKNVLIDRTDRATELENHADAMVETSVDQRGLPYGAPAGIRVDGIDLTPGMTTTIPKETSLKRAIARVAAKSGNTESIVGYHIAFDKVKVGEGPLYAGEKNEGSILPPARTGIAWTLEKDGKGGVGDVTGGFETVAYLYPSSEVTVKVKPTKDSPDADAKTVKFAPMANMNYIIKISPKTEVGGDGTVDFEVSIDQEWKPGGDLNVDFNGTL